MPKYFPEYKSDHNEQQIKNNVTNKGAERNKLLSNIKMCFGSGKRLQLCCIERHYKLNMSNLDDKMKIPSHIIDKRNELEKKLIESGQMDRYSDRYIDLKSILGRN